MRPRILAVGADRAQGGALGVRHGRCRALPAHMGAEHDADREHRERLGVVRIDGDGLFQQLAGELMVLLGHTPVVRQGAHDQVPGVEALRRLALGPETLVGPDLRLDGGYHRLGDLVLDGEHVGEPPVVATSLSCAVMRTCSPLLRTLPSTR